ncbi:MAG TPA: efflux RND transporter periplasmic adaptor subunit [Vicinamibacteria bacterium]|nr:efflux RND transporter periplasmic adaptor subunit [Vicinamibacteria bacterium]
MTAKSIRALLLVLAAGAALTACRKPPATEAETAATKAAPEEPAADDALPESVRLTTAAISEAGITTWKVQPVDLEHMLVLTGSVDHDENRLLQLAANVKGRAAAIRVDLGARVRKGDPILEIESVELGRAREELLRELVGLRVSARAYERAKTLAEAKAISAGEFQAREGDYLTKKAAAEAAERALHLYGVDDGEIAALRASVESDAKLPSEHEAPRLVLRAPFDGRVIDRKVTPGSLFEALQPLVTVADLSSVWVFLQAYEKDLALLHEGVPVTIRTEAFPQDAFEGRVDFLGSVVEKATRTVRVRATVGNRAEKLRPGMFVKAQVHVPKPEAEAKATVAVPQAALQTLEGRTTVFVQTEPGVFVRHFVETGHTFEGFTEILSGVKPGDLIVSEGSFVLKSEFAKASLVEEE